MSPALKRSGPGNYFLLWFFAIAAMVGLFAATDIAWKSTESVKVSTAPTVPEYRQAAISVINPFLSKAMTFTDTDLDFADAEFLRLVTEVRDGMLELRVPGSEKDAHLAFVLMLDRWILALDGDASSRESAVSQLRAALNSYPWVQAASAATL